MRKLFLSTAILLVMALINVSFADGLETFANYPEDGNSYQDGSFTGQDGSTWEYWQCRGDQPISDETPCLGKDRTPTAEVTSGTISGGFGTINFDYMQAFSTGVNLDVFVNNVLVGNVTSSGEPDIVKNSGDIIVDVEGDVVITFIQHDNGSGQVSIDNLSYTSFGGGTPDPEPTNYPTAFSAMANGTDINLSWADATGDQLPSKYILFAGTDASLPVPVDGTPVTDDADLSDGSAALNISYGTEAAMFGLLMANETYYFSIYSYTNFGSNVDYKTDGSAPTAEATIGNVQVIEYHNFDDYSFGNWTKISVIGDQEWAIDSIHGVNGSPCTKMSGYDAGTTYENEDWLVSPMLNLDTFTSTNISFMNAMNYTGNDLELKVSTDYDGGGDPNSATWTNLSFTLSGGGWSWTESGTVDLTSYIGPSVYVAFYYTCTADGSATWELDNILIKGETEGGINPATQLAVTLVNGGNNPYTSTDFEVVVQAQDAGGLPANVDGDVDFTFTTNGGDLSTVGFVGGITISGTILDGSFEVTVTGVQMAPEGTNVNITATDDLIFGGLIAGTSALFDVIDFTLPAIIITEIMQNPDSVSDANGEWFEVFNNSATPVDMMGWTIKDDGSDSHVIASSLIVSANGFAVLGRNSDPLLNGGYTCDYEYSGITLGNGEDEVILILPDGITEVDRVEYDGGSVWPDPHGASMVFTGFVDEDNNDGTKWTWSAFRESTYSTVPHDKGSPGTNGYSQILTGGFKLDLTLFLEGAFNPANDSMVNGLRLAGVMPLDQPYNPSVPYYGNMTPTWLYSGTEGLAHVQYYAIDWILIELRDATSAANATSGTMVAQYPAFVMDDGTVVSLNGTHALNINHIFINNMYVVVWHRNHLGIMNPTGLNPIFGTTETYDFSTGSSQVYGGAAGYTELKTGIWGMVSGDSNGDQVVNDTDKTAAWDTEAGEAGYKGYDLNLDGEVNNLDKNDFWIPNNPTSSQVPN